MNSPLYSYYHFRKAAGYHGLGELGVAYIGPAIKKPTVTTPPGVSKDPAMCSTTTADCAGCYTCCDNTWPHNAHHRGRCRTECTQTFTGGGCTGGATSGGGGGTGVGPCSSDASCPNGWKCISGQCASCGLECEGPGVNSPYTCSYRCLGVPITAGGVIATGQSAMPSSGSAIIGYDSNGRPIYGTPGDTSSDPLSMLTDHPLITLGVIGLIAWKFLGGKK